MNNAWKVVVLNSLGQVSPNGPPSPLLLLPPFISPSLPFPRTPLLYPHYPIPIYILHRLFTPSKCPHSYCILGLPPTPHFRFFGLFLAISLLSALSPTILYPLLLFIKALHSLPGPSHPPAPACPPAPIFAFLDAFLMFYCMYFFPILYIHVHISLLALNRENPTAILGCNQLPGQEQWIANFCRKKAPKKRPKIHIYPLIHTIYIPYGTYALGRPCGSLLHPPIGSSMGCTATRPRSGTEEP